MRGRIATLMWKEFIELRRSPQLLRLVLIAPILQLTLLGYAATTDVRNVPIVVVDGDRSPRSRDLVERFSASPYFEIVREEMHPSHVESDLALGRAWLAIVIPNGFGTAIGHALTTTTTTIAGAVAPSDPTVIQVIADGTDSNSSGVALAYVQGLVADHNDALVGGNLGGADIESRVRVWFNPDLVSRNFMVPGVLALLLMIVTANLTSMAIVRERELGTLDQLLVSPVTPGELMLGKTIPVAFIALIDLALICAVAILWFGIPLRGSAFALVLASFVYILASLGIGLFISTVSKTQQEAFMSMFLMFLPAIVLSGFMYPVHTMPRFFQALTLLNPVRHFLEIVRAIFLKGHGIVELWPQFLVIAIMAILVLAGATARFRRSMAT